MSAQTAQATIDAAAEWPRAEVLRAALRGTRQVFTSEDGEFRLFGVKSALPWVYYAEARAGGQGVVICERCATAQPMPPPPQSLSGTGQPQGNLFEVESLSYALYLLTGTLHPFLREHRECEPRES